VNRDFDVDKIQKINQKVNWFRSELLAWGEKHRRKFPWRNTTDAYAILVAEFMLQKLTRLWLLLCMRNLWSNIRQ